MAKNFLLASKKANYKTGGAKKADFLLASKKANYKAGGMTKSGQALFDALEAKGYKEYGGEKLLMKMTKGGMMDMTDMVTAKYGTQTKKMGMMKKAKKGGYKNY